VPLRIGCDLDGVLADMEGALVREAEKLFGAKPRRDTERRQSYDASSMADIVPSEVADNAPLQHELQLSDRERRALWRHVRAIDGFWESLDETEPGVVKKLASLAAARRWEVIFLTRRPTTSGDTPQLQSQRWLVEKGFPLPSVYVVTASRGLIAAGLTLDIVIDDTPENCVDVASDSKALTIAIFRSTDVPPPPILKNMGIHMVATTADCLDVLAEIDDASLKHSEPGAMGRVLRTLGMKQQANV
jgi:hypothetical protein